MEWSGVEWSGVEWSGMGKMIMLSGEESKKEGRCNLLDEVEEKWRRKVEKESGGNK